MGNISASLTEKKYAGFWIRIVASLIDGIILGIPLFFIQMIVNAVVLIPLTGDVVDMNTNPNNYIDGQAFNADVLKATGISTIINVAISFVLGITYFASMESSSKQGTLGKMAVGIQVTDINGEKITFKRSVARYFSKILSGIPFYIGYIMAGFTQKKQGLHDIIAKTQVVYKSR